jgi:hypothetical protein
MSSLLALASMLTTGTPAAACPTPPQTYVAVLMDESAVAIRTDFTLAQIAAMRRQVGGVDQHPNLGFYGHRFGYSVEVEPIAGAGKACVVSVRVRVHMVLSQRVIELGRDLLDSPCLLAVAEAHYRRHATADDRAFGQYAKAISPALSAAELLPQATDYAFDTFDPKPVEQRVRATIDTTLEAYKKLRQTAQNSVDSKSEAAKMVSGCAPSGPSSGHT